MNWDLNMLPACRSSALSSHQAVNQKEDLNHSGGTHHTPQELGQLPRMSDVAVASWPERSPDLNFPAFKPLLLN